MLNQFCQLFGKKFQNISARSNGAIIIFLLLLSYGCSQRPKPDVELKINSIQPAGRPGTYRVTGSTNLPNSSRITIAAMRYLSSANEGVFNSDPNTTYSILDRRIVDVAEGKWQATLNLWQVGKDGQLREAWQANQSQTGLAFNQATDVAFIANFEPARQLPNLEKQQMQGSLVRFTSDGQQYLQASQTLAIPLPVLKTAGPILPPEDIYGSWENRSQIQPEPVVSGTKRLKPAETSQTNAPLSSSEFLR